MSYLATLCDQCQRVSLVPLHGFTGKKPLCRECDEPLRVVPSCSYSAGDLSLFREVSDTVAEINISATEAQWLGRDVSDALWSGSHGPCWDKLSVRMPSLMPLQLVIGSNHARRQRALQMFKTIFEALATTRRSGIMSAVAPPAAKRPA